MELFVGIDVSKKFLDVHTSGFGKPFRVPNTHHGVKTLHKRITKQSQNPSLVICEATGGYERLVAETLYQFQWPIKIENPTKIRHFARSMGQIAKTDKADAKVICLYAEKMRPSNHFQPRSIEFEQLRMLMARRSQLIAMRLQENNRLQNMRPQGSILTSIKKNLEWFAHCIEEVDQEINALSTTSSEIRPRLNILTSIPGVGKITALAMITEIHDLGSIDNRSLASYIGLAPFNRDSGDKSGRRSIYGGKNELRSILYMAAVVAIQHNAPLKAFYTKLKSKGKPSKVALIAVMRKLAIIMNTLIRKNEMWKNFDIEPLTSRSHYVDPAASMEKESCTPALAGRRIINSNSLPHDLFHKKEGIMIDF